MKKQKKPSKPRNLLAIDAQFRKAGVIKSRTQKRTKDKLRKQIQEETDE